MFNKNVFTQTDPVADLIKGINEADYKTKMEALKGNQHKIDKNKNNKIDAHDFKILRGEKKVNEEDVDESTSVKIPTSTGTKVLGHRYGNAAKTHRDSMADPFAVVKGPGQKDIEDLEKKKVKKEEVEDLGEAKFDALKHVKNPSPAVKAAAKDVKRSSYADRAALMKAGGVKDDRGPRGVTKEEVEELDERELSKGETTEKERIVKGMKKSLAGFKARYGDKAKSVMYATATKAAKKD